MGVAFPGVLCCSGWGTHDEPFLRTLGPERLKWALGACHAPNKCMRNAKWRLHALMQALKRNTTALFVRRVRAEAAWNQESCSRRAEKPPVADAMRWTSCSLKVASSLPEMSWTSRQGMAASDCSSRLMGSRNTETKEWGRTMTRM